MGELHREYRDFVGFYWTLPLPAFGFTKLPDFPDEAARASRTIRYQREAVRRYVAERKGRLADEVVFLEIHPDRSSDGVEPYVERALRSCQKHHAQLVFVDFAREHGWRSHPWMSRLMHLAPISCLGLDPEPVVIDGEPFDPIGHFRTMKAAAESRGSPADRRAALAALVADVVAEMRGAAPGRRCARSRSG
ncbi:hypothetical protein [Azospirillum ramasamyi]|uniref:Uncharacterized protein n=1 Tax=Azospirillum ramasamyi TaxID=682998 RepID=A0A2U9SM62_9PROT|nr:hypothetical protein [Azospirillum ramasamyi]AWU98099.1 hypothetical protein DM194_27830 [Azospirillum ramasamyi]